MIEQREQGAVHYLPKKRKRLRKIWCKRHSVSGAEVSQRRDEIEQLFFPFLCFSLSFASLFQLKDFSYGKCEMSFQLRCSPKPENTVNDFIHNNIEYNRIPTSSSRTRYTQTNHHPSHPFPADTSGCPSVLIPHAIHPLQDAMISALVVRMISWAVSQS